VDDIEVLNTLQMLASACGRGQLCESPNGISVRRGVGDSEDISVGILLLVVRYGKRWVNLLDNLSQPREHTSLSRKPPTGGLGAARARVVGGQCLASGTHNRAPTREGWIDTEVELP